MGARGLNTVSIIGNLGADPELKTTKTGLSVVNLSIAVNFAIKVGEAFENRTEWIRATVFGRQGDACAQYLRKGSSLFIEGRMSTTSWRGDDDIKRWSTSVIAREVIFLDSNSQGQKSDRPPTPPAEEDREIGRGKDNSQAGGYDASEESFDVPF